MNQLQLEDALVNCEQGQLLDAEVASDLNDLVSQAVEIANRDPDLLGVIDHALDLHGLKKKALRDADRRYFEQLNPSFDSFEDLQEPEACSLFLSEGRPRIPAIIVFVLLLLRGWVGGPKSSGFRLLLRESITLNRFFAAHDFKAPGASTVADNINAVRQSTLEMILRAQLNFAKETGLETFEDMVADSTSVNANSKYPTDSGLMGVLAIRLTRLFDRLKKLKFGLPDWTRRVAAKKAKLIADELELESKRVGMLSGKRNVSTRRKQLYAKMYTRVGRLVRVFTPILTKACDTMAKAPLPPSKAEKVQDMLKQTRDDLEKIERISSYSRRRIFRAQSAPASEKVYSISDDDAAIIKKGGWDTDLGYRPQLAFSGEGLVTAHLVPEGNAADSGQLQNLLEENEKNTGVVPKRLSFDDGYSSRGVRDAYLKRHGDRVEIFSFAGSKGRQAIGGNEYDREDYRKARSERSAAESRIFTLKFNHGYGEISRRGLKEVRHEQLTKVLAFNLRKIVWLRAAKNERRSKGKAGKQRVAA